MRAYTIAQAAKEYHATHGYCSNGTPLRGWINFCLGEKQLPTLTKPEAEAIPGCDDKWTAPRTEDGKFQVRPASDFMKGDHEGEGTSVGPYYFTGAVPDATAALAQDVAESAERLVEVEALEASLNATKRGLADARRTLQARQKRMRQSHLRLIGEVRAHGGLKSWAAAWRSSQG